MSLTPPLVPRRQLLHRCCAAIQFSFASICILSQQKWHHGASEAECTIARLILLRFLCSVLQGNLWELIKMSDARPLEPGTNQALYTRSSTSAASFSSLPEVVGHGQVKANAEQTLSNSEKEVAGENEKEPVEDFAYGLPPSPRYSVRRYSTNGLSTVSKSRSTKLLWWICAGITVFLLIGVGLGVGLGIGLRPKQWVANNHQILEASNSSLQTGYKVVNQCPQIQSNIPQHSRRFQWHRHRPRETTGTVESDIRPTGTSALRQRRIPVVFPTPHGRDPLDGAFAAEFLERRLV